MTKQQIMRYNELLLKYAQDPELNELLMLSSLYFHSSKIRLKATGGDFIADPFERLVYDLEQREERILKGGNE